MDGLDGRQANDATEEESALARETKEANEKISTSGIAIIYGTSVVFLLFYMILNYSFATGTEILSALTGSANFTNIVNVTSNM